MSEAAVLERVRRRRTDITERDTAALQWVGEQYGARMDVLGVLLGRLGNGDGPVSLRTARDVVGRWVRLRLARTEPMPGGAWVTLTRPGVDVSGLGVMQTRRFPARLARHHHAVNVVRLAYEADPERAQENPWVSERLTWRERVGHTWHVPDGVIKTGPAVGGWSIGVEVELHRKSPQEYRDDVFGKLRQGSHPIREVRYFVPSARFRDALITDITEALDGTTVPARWSVRLLPTVDGVSYIPEGGGRRG